MNPVVGLRFDSRNGNDTDRPKEVRELGLVMMSLTLESEDHREQRVSSFHLGLFTSFTRIISQAMTVTNATRRSDMRSTGDRAACPTKQVDSLWESWWE